MSLPRNYTTSASQVTSGAQRRTEYIYHDELLINERSNLGRRWWGTFGVKYGFTVLLILIGWWLNGFRSLLQEDIRSFALIVLAVPVMAAVVGFVVWLIWINQRPMRFWEIQFSGREKTAFRVVLACIAEAGWTPWEIDYEHQVVIALAPEGMFDGVPPQVVTAYCSPVQAKVTEVRVQSRFIEATRLTDPTRIHQANIKTFQRLYRQYVGEGDNPNLPMPHPLARLKGRLPEEQELAVQALGRPRARARLWAVWVFISVLSAVMLHLQPWFTPWLAWPLTFMAAGFYHLILGNQWGEQERHALSHATASVIANPYATRGEMWESVDLLAREQRLFLHEVLDEDNRLYRERQPASGYPGTYLLLSTSRNDAGVEQLLAVAVPEWGLLTALMPQVYAPFHLMAFMQSLRRGPRVLAEKAVQRRREEQNHAPNPISS